jgi:hypothetical protein
MFEYLDSARLLEFRVRARLLECLGGQVGRRVSNTVLKHCTFECARLFECWKVHARLNVWICMRTPKILSRNTLVPVAPCSRLAQID